jgi:hypothetical protein
VFALFGVGRNMDSHLRAIGTGFLAAHFNGVGRQMGQKSKSAITKGENPALPPANRGAGMTEQMLKDLAAA